VGRHRQSDASTDPEQQPDARDFRRPWRTTVCIAAATMSAAKEMSVTQAAYEVLRRSSGAVHYRPLTEEIIRRGLIDTSYSDSYHLVHSSLAKHVRKQGDRSWFEHLPGGKFRLTEAGRRAGGEWVTWLSAAERVLTEASKPLHAREIYQAAVESGLKPDRDVNWPIRGLSNTLGAHILKARARGTDPVFVRTRPGTYALYSHDGDGAAS
jgi:hypothetical protein